MAQPDSYPADLTRLQITLQPLYAFYSAVFLWLDTRSFMNSRSRLFILFLSYLIPVHKPHPDEQAGNSQEYHKLYPVLPDIPDYNLQ